jgi:hypothetical protein
MEEMQKWVDKKKKKLNIIAWLNVNVTPTIGFIEWVTTYLKVTDEDYQVLMDKNIYDCVQKVFESNLGETNGGEFVHPIKCFTQKANAFYMYEKNEDGTPLWKLMNNDDFTILFRHIQRKITAVLFKWKQENSSKFHENDNMANQFNKSVVKAMNMSVKPDSGFTRMKNSLYAYLKIDLNRTTEYEFEF